MGRLLRGADRVLLNPWTTRWGGVEAIVGGGIIAAGFIGGAVTLILGFPTAWAILTAVGAFLLGGTGVATLIERHRGSEVKEGSPPSPTALAQIAEELEAAQHVLNSHDIAQFFVQHQLAVVQWVEHGTQLASSSELHKKVRAAYRAIDERSSPATSSTDSTTQY